MYRNLIICLSIIILCAIGFNVYVWYDTHRSEESLKSPDETPTVVAPLPQADEKKPNEAEVPANNSEGDTPGTDRMVTEHPKDTQKSQETAQETAEKPDPVVAAETRLDYISENLQEWGQFSPGAAKLMEQLTPTWEITDEGVMEEAIVLLEALDNYQDPRSVEVFVGYLFESGGFWGRSQEEALIAIGPPSVPLVIPYLNEDCPEVSVAVSVLSRIGEKHRDELGGAVEYIILPKLAQLLTVNDSNKVAFFIKDDVREALVRLQKTGK